MKDFFTKQNYCITRYIRTYFILKIFINQTHLRCCIKLQLLHNRTNLFKVQSMKIQRITAELVESVNLHGKPIKFDIIINDRYICASKKVFRHLIEITTYCPFNFRKLKTKDQRPTKQARLGTFKLLWGPQLSRYL